MTSLPYWHVDAFAERPFTGNQAAVIELEDWLDDTILTAISAENCFAETAFMMRDTSWAADFELRWFSPTGEVRMCGHATLASGHAVLSRTGGERVTFRTRQVGVLEVRRSGQGYALALPPIATEPGSWPEAVDLVGGHPLEVRRSDTRYTILAYRDETEIRALAPDFRGLAQLGNEQFICTAPGRATDIVSRVFVPGAGIDEDSVTGSAHAALAPYWCERLGRDAFTAEQASQRGAVIGCRIEGDRVWLSGSCVTLVEGRFLLP